MHRGVATVCSSSQCALRAGRDTQLAVCAWAPLASRGRVAACQCCHVVPQTFGRLLRSGRIKTTRQTGNKYRRTKHWIWIRYRYPIQNIFCPQTYHTDLHPKAPGFYSPFVSKGHAKSLTNNNNKYPKWVEGLKTRLEAMLLAETRSSIV